MFFSNTSSGYICVELKINIKELAYLRKECGNKPVITPLSGVEYSTHKIGPAWHAKTASHVPREMDHILAVQSSLRVTTVFPPIFIDLHKQSKLCHLGDVKVQSYKNKEDRFGFQLTESNFVCPRSLCICLPARISQIYATLRWDYSLF